MNDDNFLVSIKLGTFLTHQTVTHTYLMLASNMQAWRVKTRSMKGSNLARTVSLVFLQSNIFYIFPLHARWNWSVINWKSEYQMYGNCQSARSQKFYFWNDIELCPPLHFDKLMLKKKSDLWSQIYLKFMLHQSGVCQKKRV